MLAANRIDEALEHSNALADPAQFLGADLEVRGLCRALNYAEWALDVRAFP